MVSRSNGSGAVSAVDHGDVAGVGATNPSEERVKVVVRVRPLQAKEDPWSKAADDGHDSSLSPTLTIQEKEVLWEKNGQLKTLKADAVFANGATQDSVYRSVSACVDALIAGFDCSIFAYGQTGTGKTYTMSGLQRDESVDFGAMDRIPESHGVVPRSIERLFAEMEREKRATSGASFSVYCSFIEIYNEKIFDVLTPEIPANSKANRSPDAKAAATKGSVTQRSRWNSTVSAKDAKGLQIRQKLDGSVFVDGMTSRNVSSQAELLQAFREGSLHREVRDNLYNQFSSRGHAVFQITLRQTFVDNEANKPNSKKTRLSRLFFVDLAGSEKWHVNGSDLTDKYASELAAINKSLSALTNCVLALTQRERPHVPFRDSVLTRLLQTCLQGSGRTAFIVTISPSKASLEESFATLRFAERLKAIRCQPLRRGLFSNEMVGEQRLYYERQIQVMRAEVNRLRELLRKANLRPSEMTGRTSKDANAALVEENRRLKELLLQSERSRLVGRSERANDKSGKSVAAGATVRMSPQQFSAMQMLKSTSIQDDESNGSVSARSLRQESTGNTVEGTKKAGDQQRDHLINLENQLQSKEARLNWMLEAEMEAQHASGGQSIAPACTTAADSSHPSTVTRSWAVETRLRRKLVGVPSPMRDPGSGSKSDGADPDKTARDPQESKPVKRVLPVLADIPTASTRTDSVTVQQALQPAPHFPSRRQAPSPPTENYSHSAAGSRRNRADTSAKSHPAGRLEPQEPKQIKASAILRLVGTGSSETSGRSREELVEEYKRARRVELEAMMRTMVQK